MWLRAVASRSGFAQWLAPLGHAALIRCSTNEECLLFGFMERLSGLAPIGVSLLISSLSYGSQLFFFYIEPYALEKQQALIFNILVASIWICYARACMTHAGHVPASWRPPELLESLAHGIDNGLSARRRWCKKCEAFKPPRAHHCKICQR